MEGNENVAGVVVIEVEEQMQVDEQQDEEDQHEDEDAPPDNVQNNEENDGQTESSQRTNTESVNLDVSDVDADQACPICMEQWTTSGEHRLCCLRCGHLFGHSCILRWLQYSCNSTNRRCPQCNKKAAVKHIRMLYARKLTAIDSTEFDNLKKDLSNVSAEKNRLRMELSQTSIRLKVYEDQMISMKKRITDLESQNSRINTDAGPSASGFPSRKFYLEQSVEICKDGGCRVLDYNPWYKFLAVSQKSVSSLFNGYGIRKMDCECFNLRQFILLHTKTIRDVTFHSTQQAILLSVSFDKCAKLMDIQNNITVHTYETEHPLWSCCWSGDNPNVFLTGSQNGTITQFDIRQTSCAINVLEGSDKSPVVSMATVPPNPGRGIGRGGFIACRLNSCYTYEVKDTTYLSKPMFIDGPFVSVRYDEKNHHCLISSRPNSRQPHARHTVCTIEKNTSNDEIVRYNAVHTFQAGSSQQLLSRPCYLSAEDDTLVAAYIESSNNVSLWSIASGQKLHKLPVSDPIMDLRSFNINNNLFLTSLSATKLRLYNYGQLT